MKLDGWHRLWIVICIIYLILLGVYIAPNWPNPKGISHELVYDNLPPELRKTIHKFDGHTIKQALTKRMQRTVKGEKSKEKSIEENSIGISDLFDERKGVWMPNGHHFYFSPGTSEEDKREVVAEYRHIVDSQVLKNRWAFLFSSAIRWIVPCVLVYVFGLAVAWIYRGFKAT